MLKFFRDFFFLFFSVMDEATLATLTQTLLLFLTLSCFLSFLTFSILFFGSIFNGGARQPSWKNVLCIRIFFLLLCFTLLSLIMFLLAFFTGLSLFIPSLLFLFLLSLLSFSSLPPFSLPLFLLFSLF